MKTGPWLWFWAVLLFAGCGKYLPQELLHPGGQLPIVTTATQPLQIQFHGVTSCVIRYGNSVVLTDPFVSNPPFRKVVFGKIYPDTAAISQTFHPQDLAQVKLVTISHAHYDHLMDLPPLLPSLPTDALLTGSNTMAHIMAAAKPGQPLLPLNNLTGTHTTLGQWVYSADSTVRMMPFVSDHPPHIFGIKLYPGPYNEDLTQIPVKGRNWKQGLSLSYLIDFMEGGQPVYRVFSQSSAAHGHIGLFPKALLNEKAVDVVFISQAVKGRETHYAETVIKHCQAPVVLCTHYENFFRTPDKPLKSVPKAKVVANYQYLQSITDTNTVILLPQPGAVFVVGKKSGL